MAAVSVLRSSSWVSLRAAARPVLNVSAGRSYYHIANGTRMLSNSSRTLESVKELNVPEKSETKTAGVEGPHRRARDSPFFLVAIPRLIHVPIISRRSYTHTHRPDPISIALKSHHRRLGALPPCLFERRTQVCSSSAPRTQDYVRQSRRLVRLLPKVSQTPLSGWTCMIERAPCVEKGLI